MKINPNFSELHKNFIHNCLKMFQNFLKLLEIFQNLKITKFRINLCELLKNYAKLFRSCLKLLIISQNLHYLQNFSQYFLIYLKIQ